MHASKLLRFGRTVKLGCDIEIKKRHVLLCDPCVSCILGKQQQPPPTAVQPKPIEPVTFALKKPEVKEVVLQSTRYLHNYLPDPIILFLFSIEFTYRVYRRKLSRYLPT